MRKGTAAHAIETKLARMDRAQGNLSADHHDAVTGPCAGQPLSGEERIVGNHNDANQKVWESDRGGVMR